MPVISWNLHGLAAGTEDAFFDALEGDVHWRVLLLRERGEREALAGAKN